MPYNPPSRASSHGHLGEFRVDTMASRAPADSHWNTTAFIYHRDQVQPVATLEKAGRAEDRDDAHRQAVVAGRALIAELDPKNYRTSPEEVPELIWKL
ncbi:hypothetical protein E1J26_19680 [Xanthomonas hortorum pv. vitians]|uniref:Uncharacterized protein n=1 Tax=Xanthomonas hortorum pv. vitians TaxID=83224 RepID=A0AAW8ZQX9_9XANT|nr:hypothetical protein [Xanthomonas hortorum]MCE4552635.1 hypothetical protein [Xanthomonas hortorum pv. vitians]MDT7826207.1 hypothetical protein [Xanthomonas hortorum pv. vitians]MDV7248621.1 hypothetical protein [Xanthomonas hortorum pv. vitians]NMI32473.1 hypothetical protein [Xanthomonas hortorum pv. vitians]